VRGAVVLGILLLVPALASAQRIELGGSFVATGGYDAGERSAFESSNSTNTSAPPLTLFATSSTVTSAVGAEGRLGFALSRRMSVEGTFQFTRPLLQTRVTDDFENATPVTAEERVASYLGGGSILYHFGSGRVHPFVSGGAAYLRQLHEDNAGVVTGMELHGGGGLMYWFGPHRRGVGLRADAQLSSRSRSVGFEDKRQLVPVVGVGVTYRF